ncbi:MAG: pyridoxamine kinase [Ruminococcaceae bacterium]|nr:pyridoxamine kinase [Oscillospiraceae bacterium]
MKRIVSIQDISCIGKCSLTVALPVISAAGFETAIIPTAVLSTHSAFQSEFTFYDLTSQIGPISKHWKEEKFEFDAIYTGYLGSFDQIELVKKFFDDFKRPDTKIVVDPVMGDAGELYKGFTPKFAKEMATVCAKADVAIPNLTEACFMLEEEYIGEGYSREYIENILRKLAALGPKYVALTGMSFEEDKLGVVCYDKENDRFFEYYNEKIPVRYHGTGDVFTSSFLGAFMNDMTVEDSFKIAVEFTFEAIMKTVEDKDGNWYGVNFEEALPKYMELLGK